MKRTIALCLIFVLALAAPLWAQDEHANQETHEAMMKAGSPGEHHGHLAKLAGEWTYTAKSWAQPGAEVQEWSGNRTAKMIMDGRYLQEEIDGSFMGMPFAGMGIYAYDNLAEQYVVTWIDNMSTTVLQSTGSYSDSGFVMEGAHIVPGMPDANPFKNVIRWVDDDTFVFEWHETVPGQDDMFKMMEITYTKKP